MNEKEKEKTLVKFNLKSEIKSLGLTQKEFSKLIGIHINTVSQWVRGVNEMPKWVRIFIFHYKRSQMFIELKEKINQIA